MRGNRSQRLKPSQLLGPIPAYAGEPSSRAARTHSPRAYPRVCGGTTRTGLRQKPWWGLSPRMRGNLALVSICAVICGPIPAYAGEPTSFPTAPCISGAYPRVCGGTASTCPRWPRRAGLSPRMRGNQRGVVLHDAGRGPIPAYAGEPAHATPLSARSGAYPRVCGGTGASPDLADKLTGLSPRMRGNPPLRGAGQRGLGPIPAYAGEPAWRLSARRPMRAYPRVCGGTAMACSVALPSMGLSPRMRGNLQ